MADLANSAFRGCFIALPRPLSSDGYPSWTLGCEPLDSDDEDMPDIMIDPGDGCFSFVNTSDVSKTFYATIGDCRKIVNSDACDILALNVQEWGIKYVTFVALVHARSMLHLCTLVDFQSVSVASDIQDYLVTVRPADCYSLECFPLLGTEFACTQSEGGLLTHFAHPSTFFAVDFRCPIGTEIVATFDGEVVEVRNDSEVTGVHVTNLFSWNSLMIKSTNSPHVFAEYVHIRKDSVRVSVGTIVKAGEVICESGEAGFCPEPHLHFEVHREACPGSPSVPLLWKGRSFQEGSFYP